MARERDNDGRNKEWRANVKEEGGRRREMRRVAQTMS